MPYIAHCTWKVESTKQPPNGQNTYVPHIFLKMSGLKSNRQKAVEEEIRSTGELAMA
jgi:hypothetical protein